uniref:Uncharacterized protein n=1 Tax=Micrurus paraensis TaxID=1970185 RepID=A0A2D4KPB2_9SAUR
MIQLKGFGQLASQLNLPIKVSRCLEQWFPLLIMMELFKTQPTTVNGINWQKDENGGKLLTTVTAFFLYTKRAASAEGMQRMDNTLTCLFLFSWKYKILFNFL